MKENKDGNQALNTSAEQKRKIIEDNLRKINSDIPEKEKQRCASALLKMYETSISLGEAMGFSQEDLEQIYRFAYAQFYAGQYAMAAELFKILFCFKPSLHELATSIGICHHRMGNHQLAISAYLLSGAMAGDDPVPYFYAYDCCTHLDRQMLGFAMLSSVIEKCGKRPEYAKMKEKAQILLDGMSKAEPPPSMEANGEDRL